MPGISFSGLNGFDFGSIIDAIVQYESQPLIALQAQQQGVKDKDAALVQLNSFITKLQTQANALGTGSAFANTTAQSSNTAVITTTPGSGALSGRYDVTVSALARSQVTASTNGYSDTSSIAADSGSISFTIDGSTTEAINITQATTLAGLRDAINNQDSGVVASIVNTGSSYKLVLSSEESGAANAFTINNNLTNGAGAAPAFAGNTQTAADASLTINGIAVTSSSNDIADAIPGISLKLLSTGSSVIDVAADFSAIKESLKAIVSEYNKLREFSKTQNTYNVESGRRPPLAGDSILRQALGDVRSTVIGINNNSGQYQYLSEIGLEFTSTGELKLDEAKFNDAVNEHPSDVQALFQGTGGGDGVFDLFKARMDGLDGNAGLIKSSRTSIETTLSTYRDRIEAQELRLAVRRKELEKTYLAADQAISRLNAMTNQLAQIGSRNIF
jgi:flagellar hook-associated protein 2